MTHRLQTDLQDRLSSVLAGDFLTAESQVELMAAVAIGTIFDDLIACSEWRQQMNERRGDTAGAEHWAMERAWLVNRKEEVLA